METYSRSESKFQIVGAESVVFHGSVDDFVQESGIAEEVFGYAEPEAEELDQSSGMKSGDGTSVNDEELTGVEQII